MLYKKFTHVFCTAYCRKRVDTGKCELFGHILFSVWERKGEDGEGKKGRKGDREREEAGK